MFSVTRRICFFNSPSVSRPPAIRTFLLATLAIIALLSMPRAWATAAPTTTTLAVTVGGSAVTSVASGAVVTLTATVVSGSTPVNPGQVKFCVATATHCEDSALLATAQLTPAGIATYKFRPGIGSHSYQAVFVATSSYAKSTSTAAALTVTSPAKYQTTTAIASSGSPGNYTLTATVVGSGSTLSPTGDVSLLDTTNGNASLGTAALGTAIGGTGFTTGPTSSVGSAPPTVEVGDFNGDGIPDLVTANSADNTMSVLLGNGDGTFTLKSSPAVGDAPYSFAIGDFNGDGILDMAVANCGDCSYLNYNSNTVTVLLGNGDGTFTTKSTLTVGTAPEFVAVGDFNGDGIPDLAVTNGSDNTVSVLLGNGDGTFTTKSTLTVGTAPRFLVVSDFNGDGIPDLAVANSGDSTVTVLLGNGDGTFSIKSTPTAAPSNLVLVVADFNGDGVPDLATANDGEVTVLLGNGDGTFTAKTSSAPNYYYVSIVVGDFNGDGIPDLALSSCGSHCGGAPQPVPVLLGNGDGTFSAGPLLNTGYLPFSLAVADFNGDGTQDLASASFDDDTVTVLLNGITETATATLSNVSLSGTGTHQVDASYPGDTNFSGSTSGTVSLLAAQLATTLTLTSSQNPSGLGSSVTLTATLSPYSQGSFTTNGETVTFYNGGTSIGTGTLSSGVATLNISSLPGGTDTLTAGYSGDTNFKGSTSSPLTQTVSSNVTTSLNLSSNTNTSVAGSQITLTATLSPYLYGSFTTNGETVTFYNGGTSIGTGTLSAGVATLNTTSLPVGTDTLTAVYIGDGTFPAATSNSLTETINPTPGFVVTVATDDATGVAANCTALGSSNCSLRDALAAAAAAGAGNITFSPTVFATSQTITLAGGLTISSPTTITGPTTGSGASRTNLVTVSGGGPVFAINSGVTNAAISNLTITNGSGYADAGGGGIFNFGALTVTNSTISGNSVFTSIFAAGGGIENQGTLTLIDSAVTGNSVTLSTQGNPEGASVLGGGIDNQGTLTLINSTVSGNNASLYLSYYGSATGSLDASGGGISNEGTLTLTNSTVAGNSVNGYGIVSNPGLYVGLAGGGILGNVTGANNIISGNTNNGSEDDCDPVYNGLPCPTSGQNGNIVGASALLPLADYGGPTQTQLPLPASPAICGGLIANIPAGTTIDQRGLPRTTTYGANPPCVDSGAVQTNYSLSFSTEPPSTTPVTTDFTAAVQVKESGNAIPVSGINILTALAVGDNGSLNVGSISTNSAGIASNNQFQISAPGNDMLVATLPVTAVGVTPVASVAATSTAVGVTPSSGIEVMVGASPAGVTFMVDGVSYSATTTLTWPAGSQHTLSTTSPQGSGGTQYTFASWSDGGALTHTVTASPSTINYTVTFNTSYLLTTSTNPSQGGTVSPASGYFPANSSVILTETANPGYTFTNWTGNVTSSLPSIAIALTGPESATANFTTIPVYTVNTNLDDSAGTAANCTASGSTCSLRDALAAAAAQTSADIVFDSTVFAANQPASARAIVLGSAAGTLNVSGNTRILGPTTGNGATLTQLVTIDGENLGGAGSIFSIGGNVVLSGLAMVNDPAGAITNPGGLTVINCTISGNTAYLGGGISNSGELTVMGSTISGNGVSNSSGGGINSIGGSVTVIDSQITGNSGGAIFAGGFFPVIYAGTITIINSTITGNSGTGIVAQAGVVQSVPPQSLTIANSTISGNTGGGVLVQEGVDINTNNYIPVALTVTDSILSDCSASGTTCPTSGQNGNLVGAGGTVRLR